MSAEEAPSCSRTEEKWRNLVNDELVERQVLLPDRTKNLLDSDRGGTFVLTRQGEGFQCLSREVRRDSFWRPGILPPEQSGRATDQHEPVRELAPGCSEKFGLI
jgi:hypothetical protein